VITFNIHSATLHIIYIVVSCGLVCDDMGVFVLTSALPSMLPGMRQRSCALPHYAQVWSSWYPLVCLQRSAPRPNHATGFSGPSHANANAPRYPIRVRKVIKNNSLRNTSSKRFPA